MTARIHHYVPQCYLKGFAKFRDKPKLYVVDLNRQNSFQTAPRNVAAKRDFHSVKTEDGSKDRLENAFSKFESDLSPALERSIHDRTIDQEARILLINLVALMAIKNPRNREIFRQFKEDVSTKILEIVTSSEKIWDSQMRQASEAGVFRGGAIVSRGEMQEFIERRKYTVRTSTDYHLRVELDAFNELLPYFVARKWTLLRAPRASLGFVTSDHPICLFWLNPSEMPRMFSPGYGMKNTYVLFPISSGLAWMGTYEHDEDVLDINEEQVRHVNASIISMAEQQVYGKDGDCTYQKFPSDRPRRLRELLKDSRFNDLHAARKRKALRGR